MSANNVEKVIGRLLSEDELRIRFMLDPLQALADLHERGMPLTPDEIDVFMQSDSQIWFGNHTPAGGHLH